MFSFKRLIGSSLFVFVLAGTVLTQEIRTTRPTPGEAVAPMPAGPLVTATATAERVRFVAPGTVIQVRLEVYNEAGQKVFDTELRGGNVLDWYLQNGGGERLPAGSYATVLTIKNLSGRLSQRVGSVEVTDKTAAIGIAGAAVFSLAQQQTIGPVEDNAVFTVLAEREKEALTAVMHDGTTGQLNRTAGALSFRLGDFFSGADTEQMRLTEAGNLGIGTAAPEFKLDVAGAVRAGQGFVFGNGSRLNVNEKGALQLTNAGGELIPDASGAGTQGRLAKWIDGAGTLGDSLINDTGTALQLTAAPNGGFDTNLMYLNSTNGTTGVLAGSSPSYSANNGPFFAMRGNTYTTIPNQRGIFTISAGNVGSPGPLEGVVKFNTGNDQVRMLITAAGNVGIGTPTPTNKLDVVGNINTSTQYNIGGIRALTINGTEFTDPSQINSNTLAGAEAGPNISYGRFNSFFGKATGSNNTIGTSNSFFGSYSGYLNSDGNGNSFFGLYAGRGNIGGDQNSFFGVQAGLSNDTGSTNSFFGSNAGQSNRSGIDNVFSGSQSGRNNTSGNSNTFVGGNSGSSNTVEQNNTIIGNSANGAAGITNATAIGVWAQVTGSNSLVLGSINGTNGANADTNVGIGLTAPAYKLHVVDSSNVGIRVQTNQSGGRVASFAANGDFQIDAPSIPGGRFAVMEGGNVGINTPTPGAKLQVVGGDIAITTPLKGLILRATDGPSCHRLTVTHGGVLNTTLVPCP